MFDSLRICDLLQRAPLPPGEGLPSGVSDEDCRAFELRTGILMPPDLRKWLKMCNGPCVGAGGLYGLRTAREHLDIELQLGMHPQWQQAKWIPIAGDGCGNSFVTTTRNDFGVGSPVLFVDCGSSPDTPAYIVASSIGHFLVFFLGIEVGKRGWPFDPDVVTQMDPSITAYTGVALPWKRADN